MARHFVKITNRGAAYTSTERALHFVNRQMAEEFVVCVLTRRVLEIRMFETSELAAIRARVRTACEQRAVPGKFTWYVGDSGGSKIMKDGSGYRSRNAVSGGYRVLKAEHGIS